MSSRATLVLAALVVLVGLYIFVVDRPQAQRAEEAAHLVHLQKADITGVSITTPKGTVDLSQTDPGHWQITRPIQTPAASLSIGDLLDAVTGIVPQRTLAPQGGLAAYGLDHPSVAVTLRASGGRTVVLDLGKAAPVGNALYARLDSGPSVYLIDSGTRDALTKTAADLRQKTLADFPNADVQQVRISSAAHGALVVDRVGTDRWRIEGPGWPADDFKVTDLFFPITTTDAKAFHDGVTDPAAYGLDHPEVTMDLGMKGRPASMRFLFTKGPKVTYAMAAGGRTVLELDADIESRMTPTAISLVSTHVLPYNPSDLTRFTWLRRGRTLEVQRQGPGFVGADLSDQDVSDMFSSVNLLDADSVQALKAAPSGAPSFEIQTGGAADATFDVTFYPRTGGWYAVNRALGLEYLLPSATLDDFPASIKTFLGLAAPPKATAPARPGAATTPGHASGTPVQGAPSKPTKP